jgi:hypothetical protein
MRELTVAAFLSYQNPILILQSLKNIAHLHNVIVASPHRLAISFCRTSKVTRDYPTARRVRKQPA